MKARITISICIYMLCLSLSAQNKGIDPRQFVVITELNRQTNKVDTLYAKDSLRIAKIDVNSRITIDFDHTALENMPDYYGNFSVIANINNEQIKVAPYSKVGEKQDEIKIIPLAANDLSVCVMGLYRDSKQLELEAADILRQNYSSRLKYNTRNIYTKKDDDSLIATLKDVKQRSERSKNYLNYFRIEDPKISLLYYRIINQDKLSLRYYSDKLSALYASIQTLDTIHSKFFNSKRDDLINQISLSMPAISSFNKRLEGALIFSDSLNPNLGYLDSIISFRDNKTTKSTELKLANKIRKKIFETLFRGIVDLREIRASEGEILKISLLWYQNCDSLTMPLELNLASLDIKETGWRPKIIDSFFLINRAANPKDQNSLSPSNYKGAPGVTLMYSYGNNGYKNNILKWFEPSFGLNISYVDFYTDKDLEIGVGAVMGILRNQILLTAGYNLHAPLNGFYYGIGFSFTNLAGKFLK